MKVSLINSLCVTRDAISASIRDHVLWCQQKRGYDPLLFCGNLDYGDLPAFSSHNYWEIARHPHFQKSELVIFHFGVCYDAFHLLWLCPPGAKKIVVFHNITPPFLVAAEGRPTIERSFRQMACLSLANLILCDSDTNAGVLRQHGIKNSAEILPLAVRRSKPGPPKQKPSAMDGILRLAFIGRFVPSKGPVDALEAIGIALNLDPRLKLHFCMMGKLEWSDRCMIQKIKELMAWISFRWPERALIEFKGDATEAEKHHLLAASDCLLLPTYHEGFCVPVLEAFSQGCRVVIYENSNTSAITGGLGCLVPTGDVHALARAISREADKIFSSVWQLENGQGSYAEHVNSTSEYLENFSEERVKSRFLEILDSLVCSTYKPVSPMAVP